MQSSIQQQHFDDGLQVYHAEDGLHVANPEDGLHVNNPGLENHHPSATTKPAPTYNTTDAKLPIDHGRKHLSTNEKEIAADGVVAQSQPARKKKKWIWLIAAAAGLIILAIALGAGLGIGLKKSSSDVTTSNDVAGAGATSGIPGSVLKGTSLAAVMRLDRTRMVFYQYTNGSIGYSRYVYSVNDVAAQPWDALLLPSFSARNNTPISAVTVGTSVLLFWADPRNAISYALYDVAGSWSRSISVPASISNQSTSFSVTPIRCKDFSNGIVLLYEADGGVRGTYGPLSNFTSIAWLDFSSTLTGSVYSGLGSPITTVNSYLDGGLTLNAFFYNRQSAGDSTAPILRQVPFSNFSTCEISSGSNATVTDLSDALQGFTPQNDLVPLPLLQYPWFININAKLTSINGPGGLPTLERSFPYTRLAALNSSGINLYSQINSTALLELTCPNRSAWSSNVITISSG